ncbi:MAG: beta-ketoacyl-ACP synthase [Terriglobia bacterium]|nr:MAG: beta-ketoacyl-ACP synthase [Terriglobia bacterium]
MPGTERIAVTGMAINTPVADTLDGFLQALLAGRSAVSRWKGIDTSRIYSKVGADLSGYPVEAKMASLEDRIPPEMARRMCKLVPRIPWTTKLTVLMTLDAFLDAGLVEAPAGRDRVGAIVAGHNINCNYQYENRLQFQEEPDYVDALLALEGLDTDHAGCISEITGIRGPIYTVCAACASGNVALRAAIDEIRYHDAEAVVVAGAVFDFSPLELHAMALMGAISVESFNDAPERASRPWDIRREGFVPAHGGGALVVEPLDRARRRGAKIYAEIAAIEANADGNHLPQPSEDGQARLMRRVLEKAGLEPEQIDYVNAHATSTPLGDLSEVRSIRNVFGSHARRLKTNATKSMLGHTCWAAPVVESVAAILQMNAGRLHPSINIDELDPEVDLDVCRDGAAEYPVRYLMKNSFGFGGINCVSILRNPAEGI